jgi:hypothetical protein
MTVTSAKAPTVKPETDAIPAVLNLTATAELDLEAVAAAGDGAPAPLPRFRMLAYTGAPMRITGWRHPVILDLAGLSIPSQIRPIRFSHDPVSGVGHTNTIRVENGQLVASGVISRDTPAAREVVISSKNGFPWQASVGASVDEFEFIKERQSAMVNGREYAGPLNVVRKSTLAEISFVDLGADGQTSAKVAATAQSETDSDPQGGEESAQEPVPPPNQPTAAQIRAEALAETGRILAIRRVCGGRNPEIESQAIAEGWDASRCELKVLRTNRPRVPAIQVVDNTVDAHTLEAACLLTARYDSVTDLYDSRTLDKASQRFRGGIGLQELLLEAAWANGYTGRNFRDCRAVLRYAFGRSVEAGFSTIDIGGILSNVANKFLLEGFYSVERTWRNICALRNVSDFKTVSSYRLIGKDQYELVAPGGEIKSGTLGEEKYSNKADTYGLLLTLDRRDIINDDLQAVTAVPRKLGRGSGLKINDVFWTTFMNNAAFFSVANKNLLTGADTVLTIDGLTKAEVAFMDQVDSDGKPIGIMPAILLVPTALSAMGAQLFKSLELRDTTANTKFPVANPHQGKYRVEVTRYLANSQYTGNSAKAWYLLADASDLPVIEVAFLNGQESPTVETAEADFNKLGVQLRGYHDFGCALQDPRGGLRSKGEV